LQLFYKYFATIRTSISVKPQHQQLKLDKESTNIMLKSIIEKYIDRPNGHKCLTKFEASYNHNNYKIPIWEKQKIMSLVQHNQFKILENWSQ
jgi:hypothetical protein